MKIYTKLVVDIESGEVLEEESREYFESVMYFSGGGSKKTTTVQKSEPPAWQVPYIERALSEAERLYDTGGPEVYRGPRVARRSPLELVGRREVAQGVVPRQRQAAGIAASGALAQLAAVDPQNNPFFQSALESSIRPVFDQMVERVLPNIRGGAIASGQYGGSRQKLAEGLATRGAVRAALDTTAQMGNQAYQFGINAAGRAAQLAPLISATAAMPAETLYRAGVQDRAYEQALINARMQRFLEEQARPYNNLQYFAGLVGQPIGGTTTAEIQGPKRNPWLGAIGGGLTGASLGSMIPGFGAGAGTLLGPAGWVGMGLGALLGAFG